jgi:pimeloyl-ACP methyl ester carboxylesterase
MRQRITLLVTATAAALSLFSLLIPPTAAPAGADPAVALPVGPPLQEAPDVLAKALTCPATFQGTHDPVLFVHGTAGTGEAWSWNYGKALPPQGYDVCTVTLPDFARADMQISTEYVVYAVREMAARSHGKVDVVGFSQGPVEPRWAIKWWPDVRGLIDDLVSVAGVVHGFTPTEAFCLRTCIAPFWQMKPDSKFLAALNAGDETPGDVSYTSVYTRTDQAVWLAGGGAADPWTQSAALGGATNIAIQDICPGRFVGHFETIYDAAFYAVIIDALTHPGPADVARIDRGVCAQSVMPGVDAAEAVAKDMQMENDFNNRTGEHHVDGEPALAPYAKS